MRKTYATVAGSSVTEVRVSRGPTVEIPDTASFLIVPKENMREKFHLSRATRETLCKVLRPADCAMKIKKLTNARDGGVRVEAYLPDIERVKVHGGLAEAGLKVRENIKANPRIIIHRIPTEMTTDEIKSELIAQNLDEDLGRGLKIVYVFKSKPDKRATSCVVELLPAARRALMGCGRVYLRYAACSFADYIRVVQCYRCLSFGHFARDCKSEPSCGHCAGSHEKKNCTNRDTPSRCSNCERYNTMQGGANHSAMDATLCPILERKIKDRIAYIDYD